MNSFRMLRGRKAALALLPATAAISFGAAGSPAAASAAEATTMQASNDGKVRHGSNVRLRGQFPPPQEQALAADGGEATSSPRRVHIEFRAAGKQRWREISRTRADEDGRYAERVQVRRTGRYRAVHADGRRSEPQRIRVRARIRSNVASKHARVGERVPVRGRVLPGGQRRKVVVRGAGRKVITKTRKNGKFRVRLKVNRPGTFAMRVRARPNRTAAGNRNRAGRTNVYRSALASWYGPGFYGNRTACGQTLTTSTMGVAHKTLPCGTRLKIRNGSRTVTVRVIDRGPYSGNREFDLTRATKARLGFGDVGRIWVSR